MKGLCHKWTMFGQICATVNSVTATTSRKRPPPVSDHFLNNPFASQSNAVSKTPVSYHSSNFWSERDHFLGQKSDIFFYLLFPVNDHPTWSHTIVTKSLLKCHRVQALISADPECWQIRTVYFRAADTGTVSAVCCKMEFIKFQPSAYCIIRFSKRFSMWKIPVIFIFPSRYENALQTNGDILVFNQTIVTHKLKHLAAKTWISGKKGVSAFNQPNIFVPIFSPPFTNLVPRVLSLLLELEKGTWWLTIVDHLLAKRHHFPSFSVRLVRLIIARMA